MKIFTFLLSLTKPSVAYSFKTSHIVMNDGNNHLYRETPNTFDVLYQPPTITSRFIKKPVFNNCGFYQGKKNSDVVLDTVNSLYKPPTETSKIRKSKTQRKNYTNCGFYQGPTMCLLYPETNDLLYQPPNQSVAYQRTGYQNTGCKTTSCNSVEYQITRRKQKTYTNCGFYQGR